MFIIFLLKKIRGKYIFLIALNTKLFPVQNLISPSDESYLRALLKNSIEILQPF